MINFVPNNKVVDLLVVTDTFIIYQNANALFVVGTELLQFCDCCIILNIAIIIK